MLSICGGVLRSVLTRRLHAVGGGARRRLAGQVATRDKTVRWEGGAGAARSSQDGVVKGAVRASSVAAGGGEDTQKGS